MWNINAIEIFGHTIDWSIETALFWLLIAQVTLIIFMVIVFAILIRRATDQVVVQSEEKRALVGIELDTSLARREFAIGEEFSCDGLVITARYNKDPYSEILSEITLLTPEKLEELKQENKRIEDLEDCVVYVPNLDEEGKPTVTVSYRGKTAVYAVNVVTEHAATADERPQERELVGITLYTDNVRKEYTAGDTLDPSGLIVVANYNLEPLAEEVTDYEILPVDMTQVGAPTVLIRYGEKTIGYQITVSPAAVVFDETPEVIHIKADPIYIKEESHEQGTLRYDRSFTARLIQSDDEVKHWYTELKNNLLSYKKVKARMSWKRESYRFGRETAVRLSYRGKTLCLYLSLDPKDYEETKYKIESVEDSVSYEDTPCLYRIKSPRRVRYAIELIAIVMERLGAKKNESYVSEDFYVPYEGVVELINRGLIKRNIKTKKDEAFFRQNTDAEEKEVASTDVEIAPGIIVTGAEPVSIDEIAEEVASSADGTPDDTGNEVV